MCAEQATRVRRGRGQIPRRRKDGWVRKLAKLADYSDEDGSEMMNRTIFEKKISITTREL